MASAQKSGPKLNLSDPSTGKTRSITLTPQQFMIFRGKRIGDRIDASALELPKGVIEITGGSDSSGFPMRWDVGGPRLARIVLTKGTGFRARRRPPSKAKKRRNRRSVEGLRKRVTVRGNVIGDQTSQINAVLLGEAK
ncbi:MAG: hypothetical protein NZ920_04715 [Aigarchaeota archaeon]|nr:hypothetical protein [Aigarchaeota archaeon]MDW8093241.1 S6e family ribosomal protein [Nitrososphaerota archaeon]